MPGTIHSVRDGNVGWIIFDHPERRNAVSANMWSELAEVAAGFARDDEVRVVIMRGQGEEAFVSGADISQFQNESGSQTSSDLARNTADAFHVLSHGLDKPLIAMIHGYCIGGGLAIALCADLRYASETARFGIPAAKLGVGYGMAGVESLARVVGLSRAKEILFTARRYSSGEAAEMGLVNRIFDPFELESSTLELAHQIANNAPLTVRSVKLLARELEREPAQRDMDAMDASLRACFESQDFSEGVAAFMEKRTPNFQGR